MRPTKLFLLTLLIPVLTQLLIPKNVDAHAGGGPPFLLINGKYAQNNNLYAGGANITISQDNAPEKYLVNQPIQFKVDAEKLLVPKDVIEKSTFRWSWEDGSQDFAYGLEGSHTYPKQGSYLLTLSVKGPEEADFLVLDTVQMDILPQPGYKTPAVNIAVVGKSYKTSKPISFKSKATTDPSTSVQTYEWHFGNEVPITTAEASYTYKDSYLFDYIFLKITDANGFYTWDAIQVSADNGAIEFFSLQANSAAVQTSNSGLPVPSVKTALAGSGIGILAIIIGIFGFQVVKKKQ